MVLCTLAISNAADAQQRGSRQAPFVNREVKETKKHNANPWGLVYENAISENRKGRVCIQPISYMLNGLKIAANVYTPADYDATQKHPALVVAHPNGGVKEQVAGLYSQLMAEQGYISLAFDAAYQGESGGEPRQTDKPANRIEDIRRAADILAQYPEKQIFLRGFFHEVGLKSAIVKFDVKPRLQGKSKFNYMTLLGLALNGITSFSITPLRIIAVLGFFMALISTGVGLEVIFEKVVYNDTPNGWATLVVLLTFFGGLQLFCMGIIGEYVGQVYREVKARPRYIVETELK